VQRDLIEVHAPSRLNYSLRRRHCVLFFITPLPTMGWPKAPLYRVWCSGGDWTGATERARTRAGSLHNSGYLPVTNLRW
jgi:hypothetical protein